MREGGGWKKRKGDDNGESEERGKGEVQCLNLMCMIALVTPADNTGR